jgi:colicin import membrane protein
MPRKLKTYLTNLGFFELAVAVPSMKAALAAWGLTHNVFAQDLAKQTRDSRIIAAAEARPGTVLRRPIGSHGAFTEHAELPKVTAARKPKPAKPRINRAVIAAQDRLSHALAGHQKKIAALQKARDALDARFDQEDLRWRDEKQRLEAALAKAGRRSG